VLIIPVEFFLNQNIPILSQLVANFHDLPAQDARRGGNVAGFRLAWSGFPFRCTSFLKWNDTQATAPASICLVSVEENRGGVAARACELR
jgi:hypothetical protein